MINNIEQMKLNSKVSEISMKREKPVKLKTGKELINSVPKILQESFLNEYGIALPKNTQDALARIALNIYINNEKIS